MKSSLYLLELDDLSWNVYHDSPQHLQHFIGAIQSVISNRWNRVRLPLWSILLVNKQGFVMTNSRKYIHKHSWKKYTFGINMDQDKQIFLSMLVIAEQVGDKKFVKEWFQNYVFNKIS